METLPITMIIQDSPTAVAILDMNMQFIAHSDVWKKEFSPDTDSIVGKSYFDILSNTPDALRDIFKECLQGASSISKASKFIAPNGAIQWLKWRINGWKDSDQAIGGLIITLEDITKDKRREELLLKAEQVARIGGWEVDMATSKVYWTEVTKEIHELPLNYIPTVESGLNFYKEGLHRENITLLVTEAMKNGTAWDAELVIVTAKGNELWVRAKGQAEIIDGKCVRIYGTFQDIDEKKKIELSYKEVTDKLTAATLGSNFGVFNYDIINNILKWDDSLYRIYGVDKKDFSGEYEAWRSGLHPDDIERSDYEVAQAISGEKNYDSEFRIIWPNGEVRHIRGIIVIQRDTAGNALTMTGTNWDVTELKNTQIKLQQSEDTFKGAFDTSNIGMALIDLDGRWMKVNPSLCSSLGYTEEELLQLTFNDVTHPDDVDIDADLLLELTQGDRKGYKIEKRYLHKKGHIVHVILAKTCVQKNDGEISHFISQIMDVSLRTTAEQKLKRLVDVTAEQNNSLLNFAHIVSHNLRSHSSNLSMLSSFLNTEKDPNERNTLMKMLCGAAESLNETVLHLNEVVQVKVDAVDKMKKVNLYKSIKNVEKNLGVLLKSKNGTCTIDVPKNLNIMGIPAYVDSIILNLFSNSIKYSSPDRAPEIKISSEHVDGNTVLILSDNGLGIDMKRHGKKLFGMYKTFHRHKDAKGIGLFITKNQIEAMSGSIEVKSTVNVGTTFKIFFQSIKN